MLEAVRHKFISQVYFEDIISRTQQRCLQSLTAVTLAPWDTAGCCAIVLYLLACLGAPAQQQPPQPSAVAL